MNIGDRVRDNSDVRNGKPREGVIKKKNATGSIMFVLFDDNVNVAPDHEGICKDNFLHLGYKGEKLSFRTPRELEVIE